MPLISNKTGFYVDYATLREMILKEIAVRATSAFQLSKDTGISTATLSNFLNPKSQNPQSAMGSDTFVTLMKWGDFPWGQVVKRRKGFGSRHSDTKEQTELRAITKLLEDAGVTMLPGESVSQMLTRVLGTSAK